MHAAGERPRRHSAANRYNPLLENRHSQLTVTDMRSLPVSVRHFLVIGAVCSPVGTCTACSPVVS